MTRAATSREVAGGRTVRPAPAVASGVELVPERRPAGPAAAVVLAAGIACFALGLLSILTAASAAVSEALTLSERVGDLSGVSTLTAATFFVTWVGLAAAWRRADPSLGRVAVGSAALIALGLLGTFPPVFNAF